MKPTNKYVRVKKTKEMAQVFRRKSGEIQKRKARVNEKHNWKQEWENENTSE